MHREAIVAVALLAVIATPAGAADINGTWRVDDSEVTVSAHDDGGHSGMVTQPGRTGPGPGWSLWTDIRPRPDGSYWGQRRPDPQTTSPAAFRVLRAPDGSDLLRGCFSRPGGTQPTIARDGTAAGADAGCADYPRIGGRPDAEERVSSSISLSAFVRRITRGRWRVRVGGTISQQTAGLRRKCGGAVSITFRYKGRRVARGRIPVTPDCTFDRYFKFRRSKAPRGELAIASSWPGTSEIKGSSNRGVVALPR